MNMLKKAAALALELVGPTAFASPDAAHLPITTIATLTGRPGESEHAFLLRIAPRFRDYAAKINYMARGMIATDGHGGYGPVLTSNRSRLGSLARLVSAGVNRLVLLFLLSVVCCNAAFAQQKAPDCTYTNESLTGITDIRWSGPLDTTPPTMLSTDWILGGRSALIQCHSTNGGAQYSTFVNPVASPTAQSFVFNNKTYKIFESGIKGIGLIMEVADSHAIDYTPVTSTEAITLFQSNTPITSVLLGVAYRVRYVAVAPIRSIIGSITIKSTQILRMGLHFDNVGDQGYVMLYSPYTAFSAYPRSCALVMPSQISLKEIDADYLPTAGATAGDTPFNISLSCSNDRTTSNVRYTLTDVSNPDNVTSTLGRVEGTARGVALQVLDDGAPVSFGPDSPVAGNPNQRDFGFIGPDGSLISRNMTVRYIRTNEPLTPGNLSAGMTVTLSYQ